MYDDFSDAPDDEKVKEVSLCIYKTCGCPNCARNDLRIEGVGNFECYHCKKKFKITPDKVEDVDYY